MSVSVDAGNVKEVNSKCVLDIYCVIPVVMLTVLIMGALYYYVHAMLFTECKFTVNYLRN